MVVETIDFFREEENELPPPMALKEVVALNKAAPYEADEEEAEDGAQANGKPQDMQVRRARRTFAPTQLYRREHAWVASSRLSSSPHMQRRLPLLASEQCSASVLN